MKSSKKPSLFIKYYFIIGSVIIILFFVIYSNSLLLKVRRDLEVFPKIYARFVEIATKQDIESDLLEIILTEVVQKIDFPIIVTNRRDQPKYWKNIEEIDFQNTSFSPTKEEQEKIRPILEEMENENSFIALREPNTNQIISKIYYSESDTMKRLKFLPYFEFIIFILFIAVGTFLIIILKKREKEHLWIGLAKETAHQFGTPITSLMGWLEVLKSKFKNSADPIYNKATEQMEQDINRLENVASRFGKVGSNIKLKKANIDEIIQETISYFKPRLPQRDNKIKLYYLNECDSQDVYCEPDLLKWALENLIKNAIDAMKGKSGNITIISFKKNNCLYIYVKDEGIGIPRKIQNSIFDTGMTTKKRGWGLGLSLAKRVVEEFHNGKLYIEQTKTGEGTTFALKLNLENK
ncbi:MAG: HAMP domain-containing histidine kinase [Candidatus Cloacimonetes bacterium]|nr:HAMP domain-containing histidine kinase [Candidatus Cloacimonadota bacterium]MBS3767068.1 HAMP domain-containing histidine kinase [Candidatus Cloacimonadota bacterium]